MQSSTRYDTNASRFFRASATSAAEGAPKLPMTEGVIEPLETLVTLGFFEASQARPLVLQLLLSSSARRSGMEGLLTEQKVEEVGEETPENILQTRAGFMR